MDCTDGQTVPNIFLIICLGIFPAVIIFLSVLFIIFWSSPADRFQGIIPKLISILGMTVAGCVILIIPFDVWNTRQAGCIGSALEIIWQILFALVGVLVCFVVPWALIYYEAYDEDRAGTPKGFLRQCLWGGVGALICVGNAVLPVQKYVQTSTYSSRSAAENGIGTAVDTYPDSFEVRMSFLVYYVAILSLAGWVCFCVCGGCGLTAVPLECVLWFVYRPKKIDKAEFIVQQKKYAARAHKLIEIGKRLDDLRKQPGNRAKPKSIRSYRAFKDAVYQIDDDFKKVKTAYARGGGWIVLYIFSLVFGLVLGLISLLWIAHLIVYSIPPYPLWGGLNEFFRWFDLAFPLFGLILYSIFAFYLLFSTLAGNILVAGRIPFFTVYPIRFKDTLTSSFLFNAGLMMLSSITIVQFCATTFSKYAQSTVIEVMINTYVKHMKGIGVIFEYLHYVFFAFIFIGFVMACVNIAIKQRKSEKEIEAILNS
ncbi:hypothetical protein C9374_002131 [Naegleria lovaniensis]|uniref:LMBR1-like membrane protein n=1 Tax=Naegleria lovaniensis TaxID=51637 RepID=A0AA88GWA4_NAELO|nr:uncharacterized protein C9374_002131 [Naegleria lovaniensis]KAG2387096.1 hypothetical protein C9374_002131 [Naegleria lovaniensis]